MFLYKKGLLFISILTSFACFAQQPVKQKIFTHADTLRGSITAERAWCNVLHYDITVNPDYDSKTITGKNIITYSSVNGNNGKAMQIDLKEPLAIDSILLNQRKLSFSQEGNVWHVKMPDQKKLSRHSIEIYYSGKVHEAIKPPWDGGWTWTK